MLTSHILGILLMNWLRRIFGGKSSGLAEQTPPLLSDSDDDVVAGYRFSATIQLRTPLRVISRHGEYCPAGTAPPEIAKGPVEGVWVRVAKTWREMGIDLDGSSNLEGSHASDIGQIPTDGGDYLKFLIAVRKVVEATTPPEVRLAALKEELRRPEWADFCRKLGGKQDIFDNFFPPFLESIKGLPAGAVEALWSAGMTTPTKLAAVSDQTLLAIKGIGPAKLKAIRQACAEASDQNSELVDAVER